MHGSSNSLNTSTASSESNSSLSSSIIKRKSTMSSSNNSFFLGCLVAATLLVVLFLQSTPAQSSSRSDHGGGGDGSIAHRSKQLLSDNVDGEGEKEIFFVVRKKAKKRMPSSLKQHVHHQDVDGDEAGKAADEEEGQPNGVVAAVTGSSKKRRSVQHHQHTEEEDFSSLSAFESSEMLFINELQDEVQEQEGKQKTTMRRVSSSSLLSALPLLGGHVPLVTVTRRGSHHPSSRPSSESKRFLFIGDSSVVRLGRSICLALLHGIDINNDDVSPDLTNKWCKIHQKASLSKSSIYLADLVETGSPPPLAAHRRSSSKSAPNHRHQQEEEEEANVLSYSFLIIEDSGLDLFLNMNPANIPRLFKRSTTTPRGNETQGGDEQGTTDLAADPAPINNNQRGGGSSRRGLSRHEAARQNNNNQQLQPHHSFRSVGSRRVPTHGHPLSVDSMDEEERGTTSGNSHQQREERPFFDHVLLGAGLDHLRHFNTHPVDFSHKVERMISYLMSELLRSSSSMDKGAREEKFTRRSSNSALRKLIDDFTPRLTILAPSEVKDIRQAPSDSHGADGGGLVVDSSSTSICVSPKRVEWYRRAMREAAHRAAATKQKFLSSGSKQQLQFLDLSQALKFYFPPSSVSHHHHHHQNSALSPYSLIKAEAVLQAMVSREVPPPYDGIFSSSSASSSFTSTSSSSTTSTNFVSEDNALMNPISIFRLFRRKMKNINSSQSSVVKRKSLQSFIFAVWRGSLPYGLGSRSSLQKLQKEYLKISYGETTTLSAGVEDSSEENRELDKENIPNNRQSASVDSSVLRRRGQVGSVGIKKDKLHHILRRRLPGPPGNSLIGKRDSNYAGGEKMIISRRSSSTSSSLSSYRNGVMNSRTSTGDSSSEMKQRYLSRHRGGGGGEDHHKQAAGNERRRGTPQIPNPDNYDGKNGAAGGASGSSSASSSAVVLTPSIPFRWFLNPREFGHHVRMQQHGTETVIFERIDKLVLSQYKRTKKGKSKSIATAAAELLNQSLNRRFLYQFPPWGNASSTVTAPQSVELKSMDPEDQFLVKKPSTAVSNGAGHLSLREIYLGVNDTWTGRKRLSLKYKRSSFTARDTAEEDHRQTQSDEVVDEKAQYRMSPEYKVQMNSRLSSQRQYREAVPWENDLPLCQCFREETVGDTLHPSCQRWDTLTRDVISQFFLRREVPLRFSPKHLDHLAYLSYREAVKDIEEGETNIAVAKAEAGGGKGYHALREKRPRFGEATHIEGEGGERGDDSGSEGQTALKLINTQEELLEAYRRSILLRPSRSSSPSGDEDDDVQTSPLPTTAAASPLQIMTLTRLLCTPTSLDSSSSSSPFLLPESHDFVLVKQCFSNLGFVAGMDGWEAFGPKSAEYVRNQLELGRSRDGGGAGGAAICLCEDEQSLISPLNLMTRVNPQLRKLAEEYCSKEAKAAVNFADPSPAKGGWAGSASAGLCPQLKPYQMKRFF